MKKLILVFSVSILLVLVIVVFAINYPSNTAALFNENIFTNKISAKVAYTISKERLTDAQSFCNKNNYNEDFCFMADMSLHSGSKRFFVYDFKKDTIANAGLVTHGNCYQYWLEGRKYSNKIGCGCTSLGKYKIGKSYFGKFGLAYKLYGLDNSNNNAFKRFVVMHAHACVPDVESKEAICQSNGCPTLSVAFLKEIQSIIDKSTKPVLLYMFE